jgi:hypothetical protein
MKNNVYPIFAPKEHNQRFKTDLPHMCICKSKHSFVANRLSVSRYTRQKDTLTAMSLDF